MHWQKSDEDNHGKVEQFSFWGDIKVLFMTVFAVCGKEYKGDYEEVSREKEEMDV